MDVTDLLKTTGGYTHPHSAFANISHGFQISSTYAKRKPIPTSEAIC
jgi:hypothetical protein